MTVGKSIKDKRLQSGLTLEELANKVGTSKQTIHRYETGIISNIPSDRIETIAKALNTTPAYLMGWEDEYIAQQSSNEIDIFRLPNILPMPKMKMIPLLGTIACGEPLLAEQNIEAYLATPNDIVADFALKCKGDSMINARIFDGDIVYIRRDIDVENGQIAAVLIGEETTLKRIYRYDDRLVLKPENPMYQNTTLEKHELDTVIILGKATHFTSVVR